MGSLNSVQLIGNLGQDPELRYTGDKTAVCNLRLATTYRTKTGPEKTEWHRVVCWRDIAENSAKYLKKGAQVFVQGRIETRTWDKDGTKHYTTEIMAEKVVFLGGRGEKPANQQQRAAAPAPEPAEEEGPGVGDDDLLF